MESKILALRSALLQAKGKAKAKEKPKKEEEVGNLGRARRIFLVWFVFLGGHSLEATVS